jgi:hypothetical protein
MGVIGMTGKTILVVQESSKIIPVTGFANIHAQCNRHRPVILFPSFGGVRIEIVTTITGYSGKCPTQIKPVTKTFTRILTIEENEGTVLRFLSPIRGMRIIIMAGVTILIGQKCCKIIAMTSLTEILSISFGHATMRCRVAPGAGVRIKRMTIVARDTREPPLEIVTMTLSGTGSSSFSYDQSTVGLWIDPTSFMGIVWMARGAGRNRLL